MKKHFIFSGPGLIFFASDCPALQLPHALIHPITIVSHGTTVLVECYNPYFIVGQGTTTAPMTCYNGAFTEVPTCGLPYWDAVFNISGKDNKI